MTLIVTYSAGGPWIVTPPLIDDLHVLNPSTMTTAQLLAWEREVARLEWVSLLRAETAFEPRPVPHFRTMAAGAVSLEEWAEAI